MINKKWALKMFFLFVFLKMYMPMIYSHNIIENFDLGLASLAASLYSDVTEAAAVGKEKLCHLGLLLVGLQIKLKKIINRGKGLQLSL